MKFVMSIGLILATLLSGVASAAGSAVGLVKYPLVNPTFFMFDVGPAANPASCATPNQGALYRWVSDLSTPAGVAQMKLVMTAYTRGLSIVVSGAGTCSKQGDSEDVLYLYINQ